MKKIKSAIFLSTLLAIFTAGIVHADEYGIDQTAGDAGLPQVSSLPSAFGSVLGVALSMVAVVFFVLMLYAGIRWMIARGNEEQEEKAKETIIGAVTGMVIIMLSYVLTTFVFKGTTGGTITSNNSGSDTSWDGSYCVMKDKPTVCTKINGDSKNCVSNIPVFSTEAECASALKASATGVAEGKCVPSRSPGAFDQILQTAVCSHVTSNASPDTMENKCGNGKTDSGMNLCEYTLNPVNGKQCILSAHIDLNTICANLAENECNDNFAYKIKVANGGGIMAICKWQ